MVRPKTGPAGKSKKSGPAKTGPAGSAPTPMQLLFDYHCVLFMKMNLNEHTLTINE